MQYDAHSDRLVLPEGKLPAPSSVPGVRSVGRLVAAAAVVGLLCGVGAALLSAPADPVRGLFTANPLSLPTVTSAVVRAPMEQSAADAPAAPTEARKGPWPETGLELTGRVVSTKMDKTVVVEVERKVLDKKYKKYRRVTKRYKAHDEENQYQDNDVVVMRLGRPLSKTKRFVVVGRA